MHKKFLSKTNFTGKFFIAIFIAVVCFVFAGTAKAATLYLKPSSANVTVGDLFSVKLFVDTEGVAINNANGDIQFPTDLVQVISINSSSSIFSLWVEQPSFSNDSGLITFNGGIPNPGYTGKNGQVLSVTFSAKKSGTATFLLGGSGVLANDGLGTDVLNNQLPTSVSIIPTQNQEQQEKPEVIQPPSEPVSPPANQSGSPSVGQSQTLLPAPVIYSPVYTDQNSWYPINAGMITWTLPAGATSVQTYINNIADTTPSINYAPPIYQKEAKNLTDGVWYFHLRYFVGNQVSETTHYKIQVDSQSPDQLTATPVNNSEGTVSLNLSAHDALSGIDYYDVTINNQPVIKVSAQVAKDPVLLPLLNIGDNQVSVAAYDKAGNKKELIIPITVALTTAPVIDKYPQQINVGDKVEISGSSIYPQATIKIVIKPESSDNYGASLTDSQSSGNYVFSTTTDKNGKFTLVTGPLNFSGKYQISAYVVGPNGNNGPSSPVITTTVKQSIFETIKNSLLGINLSYLSSVSITLIIWLILILISSLGWYKYFVLRRKFKLIEKKANQAFLLLIKKARKHATVLEKIQKVRGSNSKEDKTLKELQEVIEKIESIKEEEMK